MVFLRASIYCWLLGISAGISPAFLPPLYGQDPIDESVENYLKDVRRGGLILSLIRLDTFSFRAYGSVSKDKPEAPAAEDRFEIGSVTQVFTSLLLLVARKEEVILPESSIREFFPKKTKNLAFKSLICTEVPISEKAPVLSRDRVVTCRPDPLHSGACMNFCELSLHNAGLPLALEEGFDWNPFVDLTKWAPSGTTMTLDTFFRRLDEVRLLHPPGQLFRHSNIGPALLGQLLAQAYRTGYPDLLQEKLLAPLDLHQTGIAPDQVLPGHDYRGREVPPLRLDAQAPAAGLSSSARDLSRLILKILNPPSPDWEARMEAARQDRIEVQFPTAPEGTLAGYGWFSTPLEKEGARRYVWQYGGTAGFRTFVAFVPSTKTGLVILTNQTEDLKELGFRLIRQIQPSGRP